MIVMTLVGAAVIFTFVVVDIFLDYCALRYSEEEGEEE